jgi:hypothetical protein
VKSLVLMSFEICLEIFVGVNQIKILVLLNYPNKGFGFEPSNPNPYALNLAIQTYDRLRSSSFFLL